MALWTGRTLAVLCAAAGIWFLSTDVVRSLAQGMLTLKPLGQIWYETDAGSLNLLQAVVQRYLLPELWDPVILALLTWPAWVLPLIAAALLGVLTRPLRSK